MEITLPQSPPANQRGHGTTTPEGKRRMHHPPSRPRRFALILLALLCALNVAVAQPADETLVHIESGKIRGVVADGVLSFKGIPFAQPPVGELRWRPPQPIAPWDGIRDAKAFGPDPVQIDWGATEVRKGTAEDCLTINVWRPAAASSKPLPVMVWIYGGGLISGGASLYSGDALARRGIVVVDFNYRVGRLGFFAHPALSKETPDEFHGNYGYMDQRAALQWVQRNIAAFGGDPRNVTIAGESAGGGSVLVMLSSPETRGLFHRAIIQSAGIPTAREHVTPLTPLATAEEIGARYAQSLGITEEGKPALEKLRALPAAKLAQDIDVGQVLISMVGGPSAPGIAHCILDGKLIVESPEAALRAGHWAKVPIISGATDFDIALSTAKTKDALFAEFGALAPQARALYDPDGATDFNLLVQAVSADRVMVEPSRNAAELVARAGLPAYHYRFSYVAEQQRGKAPGATHGAEIAYIFGSIEALPKNAVGKQDIAMSQIIARYWVNFIKSGDPNSDGLTPWPRYDPAKAEVLNFTNSGVVYERDPLKARLDLWKKHWE